MMLAFLFLYFTISMSAKETDTPQKGVAAVRPGVEDSKSIFVQIGDDETYFYFIFKFNALQNKVSVMTISPSFIFSKTQRTLEQSRQKAGVLQCVVDTEEEFEVGIDYYLSCSWRQIAAIMHDFTDFGIAELGENLPLTVKNFLLKGAENLDGDSLVNAVKMAQKFLDNEIGLAFLNESAYMLIKTNLNSLPQTAGLQIKQNYSKLDTNINTQALERFNKIINFLADSQPDYVREIIIKGDERACEKAADIFG